MGDRTFIELIVRSIDFQKHESLFEDHDNNEVFADGLLCLTYYDVNYANLDFENALQEKRIPYDKTWGDGDEYTSGFKYCRVLSNGSVIVQEFSDEGRHSVKLNEAIKAYQQGQIAEFLQAAKKERDSISWDDQETIMQRREQTSDILEQLDQNMLDNLVVEMCCELSCQSPVGINSMEDPEGQESALFAAESKASEINNDGRKAQIAYLLNGGYLSDGLAQHHVPEFQLESALPEERYLVVAMSTGHLTEADNDVLTAAADDVDESMVMGRDTGFLIKLYKDELSEGLNLHHGHSETIKDIIKWAYERGYQMIEFDSGAEVLPQFPTFDW